MAKDAKQKFEDVISRAENLCLAWEESKSKDADDLARFAMVLAVAAMDDFFRNKYLEIWVPYVKRHGFTDKMIKLLEQQNLSTKIALDLLNTKKPYGTLKNKMKVNYEKTSFQNHRNINELFWPLGINKLCEKAQGRTGRSKLLSSVWTLAARRHEIVHRGDLTSNSILKPVTKIDIDRIKHVHLFVSKANEVITAELKIRPSK